MSGSIEKRYARALYELAVEDKSVDDVLQGLNNLNHALTTVPEMSLILFNPLVSSDDKQKLVKTVTSNKLLLRFAKLLAHRKRLGLISDIYAAFQAFVDEAKGVQRAVIRTAIPLSDDQRRSVETSLAKAIGGTIIGKFEVAQELIGGVWMQFGDKVLDASIKGRIDDFRHALVNSAN